MMIEGVARARVEEEEEEGFLRWAEIPEMEGAMSLVCWENLGIPH